MIKIEVDSREITESLQRLESAVDDMQPAFDDIGAALAANIQGQLGQGKTPWGDAFEPLAKPRRRQGKGIGGDIPLNDTRQHIYNRITHKADSHGVEVGMLDSDSAPIGRVHQFGSDKKNIPARPFLPIRNDAVDLPDDWQQEILDIVDGYIKKAII